MRDRGPRAWLSKLGRSENRHWLLLLYWVPYLTVYKLIPCFAGDRAICTATALDSYVPFCAPFIVPYFLWFPYWGLTLLYTGLKEPRVFERMMRYFMLTFSFAATVFLLLPTTTALRPEVPQTGIFNALVRFLYRIDSDACVYPSEHVVGVFAVLFAVWDSRELSRPPIKVGAVVMAGLIIASTMCTKQHAVIDVIAALPLSALGGLTCFYLPKHRARMVVKQA